MYNLKGTPLMGERRVDETPAAPRNSRDEERAYNRAIRAWSFYDWANHAYITTTASTFFPPYFIAIAAPAFISAGKSAVDPAAASSARDAASNVFAFTVSGALLFAALLSPLLGTYADITGKRKRTLLWTTGLGGILASMMVVVQTGNWPMGLLLYFLTQIAMNVALGLNSSLLPHVARPDDLDRASSLGYAMGYAGGGLLLAINAALYFFSPALGITHGLAARFAFLSVGLWWIGFSMPLALGVGEPEATPLKGGGWSPLHDAVTRLGHTLRDIRRYRELFKMLVAYWFYMEGIGAIILLATAYGAALGLDTGVLIAMLLMTQFVAFPYALAYGRIPDHSSKWSGFFLSMILWTAATFPLMGAYANTSGSVGIAKGFAWIGLNQAAGLALSLLIGRRLLQPLAAKLDAKRAVILGLCVYSVIPIWGMFLRTPAEFFMLGWMVGSVQGGTQALSRGVYAAMLPKAKSGEFFGIYGLAEKFAGVLGPLLYGLVGTWTGSPRSSIFSLVLFFIIGIALFARVDVRAGRAEAAQEEAAIETAHAAD